MDWEQVIGTVMIIFIVSFPILIALLGPVIGGKKVKVRDLRPLLIEAVQEYLSLQSIKKESYEAFEDELVIIITQKAQKSDLFSADEKSVLTMDVVRILIAPYLKKVFKKQ